LTLGNLIPYHAAKLKTEQQGPEYFSPQKTSMAYVSLRSLRSSVAPIFATSVLALTACGGGIPTGTSLFTAPTYKVSVSPQPASIPANGTVTLTGTSDNPTPHFTWGTVYQGINGLDTGSFSPSSGGTVTYTAPATPPIFQSLGTTPPGSVAIRAFDSGSFVDFNVVITAPSVITGFNSTTPITVVLGKTATIWAYAVGSTNNTIAMQVNGTSGGSSAYGTIAASGGVYGQYVYTAPSTMPMTGNTVTITVVSQADPSKSSSMTVTLTAS